MAKEFLLDSKIKFSISALDNQELKALKKAFRKSNPTHYRLKAIGKNPYYAGEKPTITLFEEEFGFLVLPRGSLKNIRKVIKEELQLEEDNRTTIPLKKKPEFKSGFSFWEQQQEAIDSVEEAEFQSGLIVGECGSGKTEILLGIFQKVQEKTLVVVDKLALMKQWVARVKARFKNISVGIIQGKKFEIDNDIVIGSQKTIFNRIEEVKDEFGCLLCDEVHMYAARTFREVVEKISAKYRIGATATLVRKDRKEFLIYAAFGRVLHTITDDELVEQGKVEEVEMVVVPTEFEAKEYVQIREDLDGEQKVVNWNHHQLLKEMKYDEARNKLVMDIIKAEVATGHKCLVMLDRVSHCIYWVNMLKQERIEAGLMVGEKEYKEQRESAPILLEQGKIQVIVMNNSIQQGLDIPILDRGFGVHPSAANPARLQQQRGRLKRTAEGKHDAKFYYFWDRKVHGFEEHLQTIRSKFRKVKVYAKRKWKKK